MRKFQRIPGANRGIRRGIVRVMRGIERFFARRAEAGAVTTTDLVNRIYDFCEAYSGIQMYKYQMQFSKRIIRSVLENDGEELTALFSRQSGKTETVSVTVGGLMIILPKLANLPMFLEDKRLSMFRDGLWVGIFAPNLRQSQITYRRMRARLQSPSAIAVLEDPDFRLMFTTSNGQTVALSNGSYCTAISASDESNIEGETFKFIILEECQDISNLKIQKCLTGDTRVLLSDGTYKPLEDVVHDRCDEVVCFDKDLEHLTSKVPYEFYDNGVQDVYEVLLDNGAKIKATLNHQFYTYSKIRKQRLGFRTLQEIVDSGDKDRPLRIAIPDSLPYFSEACEFDYEKGLILGYLLGDGCVSGSRVQFIGTMPTCRRLLGVIRKVFGKSMYLNVGKCQNNMGAYPVAFASKEYRNPLISWLKSIGVFGVRGKDKNLPDGVYSKDFYRGYVEGLIETDGCIEGYSAKPVISFANISKEMVCQLQDILLKFGVHSTRHIKYNEGGLSENTYPLHLLHVKSVHDIQRFSREFSLFEKQWKLDRAFGSVGHKVGREYSRYYPDTMRFAAVKDVRYVGKRHTYCLGVEGRNFIAENMVSSNSIHPMGAAYNSTICKIGTPTTFKGDFYDTIERNKREYKEGKLRIRNHFEYDYRVAQKYNPRYAKYVEREKRSLGETSDAFQMSYCLRWIISRGMFVDIVKFQKDCGDYLLSRVSTDLLSTQVAGIDVGGGSSSNAQEADSTVITILEVDWNHPVQMETVHDEDTQEDVVYMTFNTYVKDWLEISPEIARDYNDQYEIIMEYLSRFRLARIVVDATREASLGQRINANVTCPVELFTFGPKSKSELYKNLDKEINTARLKFPMSDETKKTREYQRFIHQFGDLQKGYSGSNMVVSHPQERGAHDDYCDSLALAVWGARMPGQVDETETMDRKQAFSDRNMGTRYGRHVKSRNRMTARRR